jgi:hypothetical protein
MKPDISWIKICRVFYSTKGRRIVGLQKRIKRAIGIKELKARGFSYQQIGEKIREFKRLGYVPIAQTDPLPVFQTETELQPIRKISVWQRIAIWFERLILSIRRKR